MICTFFVQRPRIGFARRARSVSGYLRANSKLICPQQWAVEIGILTDGFLLLGMNNQREWDGLPLPRNCGRGWVDGISVGGAGGFVKKVH